MALTEEQLKDIATYGNEAINFTLTDEGAIEFAKAVIAALPKPEVVVDFICRFKRHVGGDGEFWLHELEDFYTESPIAPHASEQKPDLRAICIAGENTFMMTLADCIVGNANPEEDSRLDVAYAIARHLKLDWPSAYEATIAQPASAPSEQKPKFGCHCDIEDGMNPYGCVIDEGRLEDCVHARRYATKDECNYWKPIVIADSPQPDHKAQQDINIEAIDNAIAEALGEAYDCTRVWSAWSYGTMGPDDFQLVSEDPSRIAEIRDAILASVKGGA